MARPFLFPSLSRAPTDRRGWTFLSSERLFRCHGHGVVRCPWQPLTFRGRGMAPTGDMCATKGPCPAVGYSACAKAYPTRLCGTGGCVGARFIAPLSPGGNTGRTKARPYKCDAPLMAHSPVGQCLPARPFMRIFNGCEDPSAASSAMGGPCLA